MRIVFIFALCPFLSHPLMPFVRTELCPDGVCNRRGAPREPIHPVLQIQGRKPGFLEVNATWASRGILPCTFLCLLFIPGFAERSYSPAHPPPFSCPRDTTCAFARLWSTREAPECTRAVCLGAPVCVLLLIQHSISHDPGPLLAPFPCSRQTFVDKVRQELGDADRVKDGKFGAKMDVAICNDGPVTMQIEFPGLHPSSFQSIGQT